MFSDIRARLMRLRRRVSREQSPRLADETRWYTEHTALLISTLKWALLGAGAGACVGLATRVFLAALARSAHAKSVPVGPLSHGDLVHMGNDVRRIDTDDAEKSRNAIRILQMAGPFHGLVPCDGRIAKTLAALKHRLESSNLD